MPLPNSVRTQNWLSLVGLLTTALAGVGCSSVNDEAAGQEGAGANGPSGGSASGGTAGSGGLLSGSAGGGGTGGGGPSGGSASGGQAGAGASSGGAASVDPQVPPQGFWDASGIPAAQNVLMFKFLNRTNGKFSDSEVYWSFKTDSISETHSIAEQPTYDMPANSSGRMYFYICAADDASCADDPTKSKYYDFIEHTIGDNQYNGNTTRVDAFGLKLALLLHAGDGAEDTVGEDYRTFAEDRETTFQQFLDFVPEEFDSLAQEPFAPYRIVEPGASGFNEGGAHADYYAAFVDEMWANNGITVPKPGANANGLGDHPDLSAAIYRHVGNAPGTFGADGKLLDQTLWEDSSKFYQGAPAHYYAAFWHEHSLRGRAYGFPYDDVGGYSTYISRTDPEYMLVAIGW